MTESKNIQSSKFHLVGPHGLSIRHLEVVWAVIRSGSQASAATMLGISQPAISKMLKYVESRTKLTLFYRVRGRLMPSDEAMVLYNSIGEIFEKVTSSERLLEDLQHWAKGHISVAFSSGLGSKFTALVLADYQRKNPSTRLRVKLLPPPIILERIAHRELDIGVFHGPLWDRSVQSQLLSNDKIVCLVPVGHKLENTGAVTPDMVATETLITGPVVGPHTWMQEVQDSFQKAGVPFEAEVECMHTSHVAEFVAKGIGVGLVPPLPCDFPYPDGVRALPFEPTINAPLVAVMPANRPPAQATALLMDCLGKLCAD